MGDIVSLQPANDHPHGSGEVKCLACKHEWVAVAPIGRVDLECPECGCFRGAWKYPFGAEVGARIWKCYCNCEQFYMTDVGTHCIACGTTQNFG